MLTVHDVTAKHRNLGGAWPGEGLRGAGRFGAGFAVLSADSGHAPILDTAAAVSSTEPTQTRGAGALQGVIP